MEIRPISNLLFCNNRKINLSKNGFLKPKQLPYDTFQLSFKNKNERKTPKSVSPDIKSKVVEKLKKGTSGFRAPYLSEVFTPETIELITLGTAGYLKENTSDNKKPTIVIGGDTRQSTRELLPKIKDTLLRQGIDVIYIKDPTPTPLIALAAKKFNTPVSILMTASHNPWNDGGLNFITPEGAVAPPEVTEQIAKNIEAKDNQKEKINQKGRLYEFNPYNLYMKHIDSLKLIDFNNIKNSELKIFYDGLMGTGQYVLPKLLKDKGINFEEVKSSGQKGPEPKAENLGELSRAVINSKENLKIGITNDGDADRFGVTDENGKYINPSDVMLLIAYHLVKNKHFSGDIVKNHASSILINKLAEKYGLNIHETPVGFKYLASDILKLRNEGKDILLAGEESGGLTVKGHIPEKDGIIADLLVLDLVAKEKKPVTEILKSIKKELGTITCIENYSVRLEDEEKKEEIIDRWKDYFLKNVIYASNNIEFGEKHTLDNEKTKAAYENIIRYKPDGDGYRFIMTDDSTVIIRKSGTEPLIRYRIEASGKTEEEAKENADILKCYMLNF